MASLNFNIYNDGIYRIGSLRDLTPAQVSAIVTDIKDEGGRIRSKLNGRAQVRRITIEGLGAVVLKQYLRGGLLRYLVERSYLRCGTPRPEWEFRKLLEATALGIHCPDPVAFVYTTGLFYQGWLLTAEIPDAVSLASISESDEDRARSSLKPLSEQIVKLIENRLFHVDLHPGNVVISQSNQPYLIDFDKAVSYRGNRSDLRDLYLNRWRRAVIKHSLPEFLIEQIGIDLKRYFD